MKKTKKKATKLKINRETMLSLENEPLMVANGGISIPCMPTYFRTCQTCCHTSCF
jgi:hypothetical protein